MNSKKIPFLIAPSAGRPLAPWLCVATVAAVVSYRHAYALVRAYGEDGWTACSSH